MRLRFRVSNASGLQFRGYSLKGRSGCGGVRPGVQDQSGKMPSNLSTCSASASAWQFTNTWAPKKRARKRHRHTLRFRKLSPHLHAGLAALQVADLPSDAPVEPHAILGRGHRLLLRELGVVESAILAAF